MPPTNNRAPQGENEHDDQTQSAARYGGGGIPLDGRAGGAGGIARDLDADDPALIHSAIVAATALELQIPVACIDDDFFSAMGCEIADVG